MLLSEDGDAVAAMAIIDGKVSESISFVFSRSEYSVAVLLVASPAFGLEKEMSGYAFLSVVQDKTYLSDTYVDYSDDCICTGTIHWVRICRRLSR